MEFFIAFFNFALAMWLAWRRRSPLALYVFFAGMIYAAAIFLRHAVNPLPLSF
ncbi:MAG TPA: DUF5993 family protein [Hyphomicrobium sp.]|nr:DUF5993 family protein [Hyphomicrobium sp.]